MSYIAIKIADEIEIHMTSNGVSDYDTACGIDGNDEVLEQSVVPVPRGAKINCRACWFIWLAARDYNSSDFVFVFDETAVSQEASE